MNVNELLDAIEVTVEEGTTLPMMPGKHLVDFDKVQAYVQEARLLLPGEIRQAKLIVNDRSQIIQQANKQADGIVRKAETRAQFMVSEQEIVKAAQKQAAEILAQAKAESRELRKTVTDYCENMLLTTEKTMTANAMQVKTVCANLRQSAKDATLG